MTAPLVGYQYVVLRCVPRVDRDEFINVGVVLHSQSADFLDCAFAVDPDRLRSFSADLDLAAVDAALQTVCAIGRGEHGPVAPRWTGSASASVGWPRPEALSSSPARSTEVSPAIPRPSSSGS